MGLDFVTITGIDDEVPLQWVSDMMAEYPDRLEFGVLMSRTRKGTPRYPSPNWMSSFLEHFSSTDDLGMFSVHACGTISDAMMHRFSAFDRADYFCGPALSAVFSRVQLNNFPESGFTNTEINGMAATKRDTSFVIPLPNQKTIDRMTGNMLPNVHFLHDRSRGKGISPKPDDWPLPMPNNSTGYAGGINPDTVRSVLDFLCKREADRMFWIDLETGARTNDRLDTKKVEKLMKYTRDYFK